MNRLPSRSTRLLLALLLSLIIATAGCGTRAPTRGDAIVYVAVPLSGFQANAGQTVLGGVRLMAEQLNRSGGLLGYRVVVVGLDDESDSNVALAVADQIREQVNAGERVIGVIGHLNSGQTLAAMEIYKDLPIIVMTPTTSEVSLTRRGYRNFFRINANDEVQAQADARFLADQVGAKRIALVHNDTEYGIGLRDQMANELAKQGLAVALTVQVAEGQETYGDEIRRIGQSDADAIFYAGYEIEAPYLRLEAIDAGLDLPMLASDGAFLTATIDEAEGRAEGMYVSAFAPSPAEAADQTWVSEYRQVEFRNPDTYSINGYSSLAAVSEAAERAKSLAFTDIGQSLREITLETLIGQVSYEDSGDLTNPKIYIFQVQEGRFVQVSPAE